MARSAPFQPPALTISTWQFLIVLVVAATVSARQQQPISSPRRPFQKQLGRIFIKDRQPLLPSLATLRGGNRDIDQAENHQDHDKNHDSEDDNNNDEERYSRQFYTLGARAHTLVRSSTIVLDGPPSSGLLYECAKNLVLSGVGKIVILEEAEDGNSSSTSSSDPYHCRDMDDLGNMYQTGARAECTADVHDDDDGDGESTAAPEMLLLEYLRRLNPSVKVCIKTRSDFMSQRLAGAGTSAKEHLRDEKDVEGWDVLLGTNPVLLCVDRPQSIQLMLNDACRTTSAADVDINCIIPFVSVETAGVFGRAFCDFGDSFHVVDEDGETPKVTLLDRVEQVLEGNNSENSFLVHCIDGEKHDVSKGDQIVFRGDNGQDEITLGINSGGNQEYICKVVYVKNPKCFRVELHTTREENDDNDNNDAFKEVLSEINQNAGYFTRVKVPRKVPFVSLSEALENQNNPNQELFAASDLDKSFDFSRRSAIMSSFAALDEFVEKYGRLPSCSAPSANENDLDDTDAFFALAKKLRKDGNDKDGDNGWTKITRSFAMGAKAKFTPLQALYGALGAQEALKAASGLYNPIRQFLLYDCDEILATEMKMSDDSDSDTRSGMSYILGKKITKKLATARLFLVGSGAIGCEILKNLSAMGAGTKRGKKGGSIVLTDMDTIEKSNLSRQLLFRDADVGKFKSAAAKEAVHRLNPLVNIEAHTSKVGEDAAASGGVFNDEFWSNGVDVVLNALDNVEARLYIDSQCVANKKGLVDAGTLGSKGNVQVVVPNQSESYGSSVDPPEPAIPVCTLKNFPYEISHTIQWGRDLFDGLFTRRPGQVNDYFEPLCTMGASEFAQMLIRKLGEDAAMEAANEMSEDFVDFGGGNKNGDASNSSAFLEKVRTSSLVWAVQLANELFSANIQNLLAEHPEGSVDDEGDPFWSGTRRMPKALTYLQASHDNDDAQEQEQVNNYLLDFVRFAARLRIEAYVPESMQEANGDGSDYSLVSVDEAKTALESYGTKVQEMKEESMEGDNTSTLSRIISKLKVSENHLREESNNNDDLGLKDPPIMNVASFEKDNELNGHVDFVTAASNLRALCYGISPVDAMETRRVAGRIVPAMITTTAFVSALSCVELVKLLQGVPLSMHRNAFVNLALPFFAFTAPVPAEESQGLNGSLYTIWDRIEVKEGEKAGSRGGMTLRRFMKRVEKKAKGGEAEMEISSVSYGPYMLYANFLHAGDESVLDRPIWELVKEAVILGDDDDDFDFDDNDSGNSILDVANLTKQQSDDLRLLEAKSFIDFSVLVEDTETGEEIELPPVRLLKWRSDDDPAEK